MLGITVHAIKRHCPVYEMGDRIVIENPVFWWIKSCRVYACAFSDFS